MHHDQLWAPWRLGYILNKEQETSGQHQGEEEHQLRFLPGGDPACFICRAVASDDDRGNLVIHRGATTTTLINRFPYNNGHLLVCPSRHAGELADITAEESLELCRMLAHLTECISTQMKAEGFNIGLNLGAVAGAGLPGHLHWHIVPRWQGDQNFMPSLAAVQVLPQSLESLWELLHEAANS